MYVYSGGGSGDWREREREGDWLTAPASSSFARLSDIVWKVKEGVTRRLDRKKKETRCDDNEQMGRALRVIGSALAEIAPLDWDGVVKVVKRIAIVQCTGGNSQYTPTHHKGSHKASQMPIRLRASREMRSK